MHSVIQFTFVSVIVLVLSACVGQAESPEMNQCAQQNFQCESNCQHGSNAESLQQQVCSAKCVEQYNQCKLQAQQLLKK